MLLCREPSSLGASATTGDAPSGSGGPSETSKADAVADVLDWLGRLDWGGDTDDEIPAEEANGPKSQTPSTDEMMVQRPRKATVITSVSCPAAMGPGRLLGSIPRGPASQAQAEQSGQAVIHQAAAGAARAPGAAAGAAAAALPAPHVAPREAFVPRRPLGGCASEDRGRQEGAHCCQMEDRTSRDFFFEEEEEEEWEQRQRKSGTVGRLVVYRDGESPKEDVVLRGGGGRRHVVVAGVREGGQATRVGVRAGDRLVSINGKKDFLGLSADEVREKLESPCILVFLGFVGKLQAEVRLTCTDNVCGLSARQEVVKGSNAAPVRLCEERVFDAGIASLFLSVGGREEANDETGQPCIFPPRLQIFELQRNEACGLVKKALRKLETLDLLGQAALTRTVGGAVTDGSPQSLAVGPPSPQVAQALAPGFSGVHPAPAPPPPAQPGAYTAVSDALVGREESSSSNVVHWEDSAGALARALFREDAAALALSLDEGGPSSAGRPEAAEVTAAPRDRDVSADSHQLFLESA